MINFGGIQKMTLLDYPKKVAATLFTTGCSFRCHFCHNPELVLPEKFSDKQLTESDVLNFLSARRHLLEGVCVTGGEPTLHSGLADFLKQVKGLGYAVKLDTNGTSPTSLAKLLADGLLDYIAMDIKAPWAKYERITGVPVNLESLKESVKLIMDSGLPHEFRSTVLPSLHPREDIIKMARQVKGAEKFFLQQFIPAAKLVNGEYVTERKYFLKDLEAIRQEIKEWFTASGVR